MRHQTRTQDYSVSQKVIHWLIAAAIMTDLVIAQKFGGVMEQADRIESRSDHASLGMIVAVLFVIRMVLRWRNGAPPMPDDMPLWQQRLAHFAHWALYGLIGALIVSGILSAMNANSTAVPFGLFSFGDGTGSEPAFVWFRGLHEVATNLIIALIALHIAAAVYHLVFVRDGVAGRMLKFWKSEKAG